MTRLVEALEIPLVYICYQGSRFTAMEALMIMLRRLTYPNRLCDLVNIFGRSEPELSMIFNMVNIFMLFCLITIKYNFASIVYMKCFVDIPSMHSTNDPQLFF